ncbi:MAG: type IVB secretion system protein IcmH/DotU [Pseudomonadota bacterium]
MNKDDPFGLMHDPAMTVVRPVAAYNSQPKSQPQPINLSEAPARVHDNPVVVAFARILDLSQDLRRANPPEDPEGLRVRLHHDIIAARDVAVSEVGSLHRADSAAWLVAALIDDLVLNTPWGGHGTWPSQSLVATIYGDVDAGVQFFERLEELRRYPDRDPNMLELAYLCLSLGFQGKYRVEDSVSGGSLAEIRAATARLLFARDAVSELSPNWHGVTAANEPPRFAVPIWTLFVGAAVIATFGYILLDLRLSDKGEHLYDLAYALPPREQPAIYRPERNISVPDSISVETVEFELLPQFEASKPEALSVRFSGKEDNSAVTISVEGDKADLFQPAQADLVDAHLPLVESLAKTIVGYAEFIGNVTVVGHTDSVKMRPTRLFQDNTELSEGRAKSFAALLEKYGVPPELIQTRGAGATEPVTSNASREGRTRNRRVELIIRKSL